MTAALTAALGIPLSVGVAILTAWCFSAPLAWAVFAGGVSLVTYMIGWTFYWGLYMGFKSLFGKKKDGHGHEHDKPKKRLEASGPITPRPTPGGWRPKVLKGGRYVRAA